MLLKLTNATKDRVGDALILNSELIISFFENKNETGELVTVAFGVNGNSWEISESINDIINQFNKNELKPT